MAGFLAVCLIKPDFVKFEPLLMISFLDLNHAEELYFVYLSKIE